MRSHTSPNNPLFDRVGVLFVTSRILIMDLLTNRIPVHLVTGVVVLNAERVIPMSSEVRFTLTARWCHSRFEHCLLQAFILRLFRYGNQTGFIKALSHHPEGLTNQTQIEKILKCLWLRRLFLWPRFEQSVMTSLSEHAPRFEEIRSKRLKSAVCS
jgi:DNA excision repair protein ERCC-4